MLILSVLLKSNKMLEIVLLTAQTSSLRASEYQLLKAKFEKKKNYKLIIYSNIQKTQYKLSH